MAADADAADANLSFSSLTLNVACLLLLSA
jgi:hypothetical protein